MGDGTQRREWPKVSVSSTRARKFALALAIFAFALWQCLPLSHRTPVFGDETLFLYRARYIEDIFHPSSPSWKSNWFILDQPPGIGYAFGLGLLIQGEDPVNAAPGSWDWAHDLAWNIANGNAPRPDALDAGRNTNVVLAGLTLVLLYLLVSWLVTDVAGVIAAVVFGLNPMFQRSASVATGDILGLFAVMLGALAVAWLADRPSYRRMMLTGVILGFGGVARLTPLLMAVALAALGGVLLLAGPYPWRTVLQGARNRVEASGWRRPDWRLALMAGVIVGLGASGAIAINPLLVCLLVVGCLASLFANATLIAGLVARPTFSKAFGGSSGKWLLPLPVVAWIVFVGANPFLWSSPLSRTQQLFTERVASMDRAATGYPGQAINGYGNAIARVWQTYVTDNWATASRIHAGFGWLDLLVGLIGVGIVVSGIWRKGLASPLALASVFIFSQTLTATFGIHVYWNRYHLYVLLVTSICAGVCGAAAWSLMTSSLHEGRVIRGRGRLLARFAPAPMQPLQFVDTGKTEREASQKVQH